MHTLSIGRQIKEEFRMEPELNASIKPKIAILTWECVLPWLEDCAQLWAVCL